jgi:hypothetical protein
MREIALGDTLTQLKNPNSYHPSFVEFVKSCLIKDPKLRPNAEEVLKINKKFFSLAKDKEHIRHTLLKDVPDLQKRVRIV